MPQTVLVIGAGVSGLTCALQLRQTGIEVTVLADRFAPSVTSVVAGALWEWPPAVCGTHQDEASLERSKRWCAHSYPIFRELAHDAASGVFVRPVTYYFPYPVSSDPLQVEKLKELPVQVGQFRHDPALIRENGINPSLGLQDAYSYLAPMIDTDVYMSWLLDQARQSGCRIVERKLSGLLRDQEHSLRGEYQADVLVNCTGLGAKELSDPSVFPVRGALVRVRNVDRAAPLINQAHCISRVGSDLGFVFILPRGNDLLVLGGLAEPDEWDLDINLQNHEPIRAMYERCLALLPGLRDAAIDLIEPTRVGLRPFRPGNVRLEQEPGTRIVHNYGHGGSGVSYSWGCAAEVLELVRSTDMAGRGVT